MQGAHSTYGSYKESGDTWLGNIPAHWIALKAKYVFEEVSEKGHPNEQLLSATQKSGLVPRDDMETRVVMPVGQLETFKLCRQKDFVISLRSFQGGIELSNHQGLVSPAYTVLRRRTNVRTRYLKHLLKSSRFIGELDSCTTGIRQGKNISFSQLSGSLLPIPPDDEQIRIAAFLDEKTAEIDAAVEKKRRLIALLNEQKAILINRAVTKGLNPEAPMKDSGVDWIGEIPAHWDVKRLKYLFEERNSRTKTGAETLFSLRMIQGLVPHNDVSDKPISDKELIDYKHVQTGQMVMNRMRAAIGIFAVASSDGLVSPDYAVFDMSEQVNSDYFLKLFKTTIMGLRFRLSSKGLGTGSSGFMRLYTENFGNLKVAVPPLTEQAKISKYIGEQALSFDETEKLVGREIETLIEFKQTLIANAVTGKIKI